MDYHSANTQFCTVSDIDKHQIFFGSAQQRNSCSMNKK